MTPFIRNLLILAAVAVVIVLLNLETAVITASLLLRIAFIIAIAVVAYFYWRDFGRREISIWPGRAQAVFYGAIALLAIDLGVFFTGTPTGRSALALIVVGAIAVYAGVRTWLEQRRVL